jgi:tRNA-splicing ligase RtcB (3'-phosphate/5'-hydroxy nucleic acid ligase)
VERLSKKLMSWASILEDGTREQALRTASLPFIHPWVALMPDAHQGRGATIGSVIPTLGAVIPAAVGVDIGCFHGDTRVPLLDGTQRSLKDLAEGTGPYWVYSLNADKQIVPGLAVALRTRCDAELLKVTISGGDEIICTPDHPFMMNDGTYRQARELRFNDSLMPLYRRWQTRDGYESVSIGKGTARLTHNLVYEALNGPVPAGFVVHHRNHVHFDNAPGNLELLKAGAHSSYHRIAKPSFNNASPEFQARRIAGIRRSMEDPARQAQMVNVGTQNILRYMSERPEHFREATAGNGHRGAPHLVRFNTSPRICDDCGDELANPAALRWHKHREHGYNHKVILVAPVGERADVYCLQVEKHHNFALAAGVFVHNCGMIAVRSQFTAGDLRARGDLAALRRSIERVIPLSAGHDNAAIYDDRTTARIAVLEQRDGADSAERTAPNWRLQLGSLGSGNHFIEVSLDEEDRVWLFLHSGSRGVGNRLARKHIKIAQNLARQWWIPLPDPDLAYLVEGTDEFWAYLRDLRWAQHFALLNREEMMDRAADCLGEWIGQPVEPAETVNTHHNYTAREKHFGKEVWVSRKGAIEASAGSPGLIPGSMGTRSYVVTGKGSRLALNSAPHGAGRQYSRSAARKKFSRAELEAAMTGIEWRRTSAFLDEIPAAYKSIDVIMNDAQDLVEIRHTLRQVVNVKGD